MITIEQIKQQEQIKDQAQDKANEERNKWFLMIAQYNKENEVQYEDRPKKNPQTSQALVRPCTKFINVYFQSALMSKGSQPRPHDKDKFNKNFDLIFNKRKEKKNESKRTRKTIQR